MINRYLYEAIKSWLFSIGKQQNEEKEKKKSRKEQKKIVADEGSKIKAVR